MVNSSRQFVFGNRRYMARLVKPNKDDMKRHNRAAKDLVQQQRQMARERAGESDSPNKKRPGDEGLWLKVKRLLMLKL